MALGELASSRTPRRRPRVASRPGRSPPAAAGQPRGQRIRIAGRDDQRAVEPGHRLGQAAGVGDDARGAAGGGLEHDETEALDGERRHRRHVGRPVGIDELLLGDAAEHANAAPEGAARERCLHPSRSGPVADQQQLRARRQSTRARCSQASSRQSMPIRGTRRRAQTTDEAPWVEIRRLARAAPRSPGLNCARVDSGSPDPHRPGADPVALDEHPPEGPGQDDQGVGTAQGVVARAPRRMRRRHRELSPAATFSSAQGPWKWNTTGRAAQRPRAQRPGCVESEMGVEHLAPRRRAAGRPRVGEQPPWERRSGLGHRIHARRRVRWRGRSTTPSASGRASQQSAVVAVEAAEAVREPAEAEHQDPRTCSRRPRLTAGTRALLKSLEPHRNVHAMQSGMLES